MIERYPRPEIGAVWTDEARMTAWRDVEVAAAEALDGPSEADLQAIRTATFTVEAGKERERVTHPDPASRRTRTARTTAEAITERKRVTGHAVSVFVDVL